jgi:predicted phosphodiesterase
MAGDHLSEDRDPESAEDQQRAEHCSTSQEPVMPAPRPQSQLGQAAFVIRGHTHRLRAMTKPLLTEA